MAKQMILEPDNHENLKMVAAKKKKQMNVLGNEILRRSLIRMRHIIFEEPEKEKRNG